MFFVDFMDTVIHLACAALFSRYMLVVAMQSYTPKKYMARPSRLCSSSRETQNQNAHGCIMTRKNQVDNKRLEDEIKYK